MHKYNIRKVEEKDIDTLVEMYVAYFRDENPILTPSREALHQWVTLHFLNFPAVLLVTEDNEIVGGIGWQESYHPFSGDIIVKKTSWYVLPEHRGEAGDTLLEYLENHAKQIGAKEVWMSALDRPVAVYLEQKGYSPLELNYIKRI